MSVSTNTSGMIMTTSSLDWALVVIIAIVVISMVIFFFFRGRASTEARAGFALGIRGLLGKDIRSRNRGWRPILLLTGYLGLLSLGIVGSLGLLSMAGAITSPYVGSQLFSALGMGAVLLIAFITPALTVSTISGERERRTLDLLLVTRASPLGLAAGKLACSLFYVIFLLVASLPVFALVYLFGGVPAIYVIMVLAVAIVTALAHASLGLLLSALLKRTILASVASYLLVLFLIFGLPIVSTVAGIAQQQSPDGRSRAPGTPPAYSYASPLTSVSSVLPADSSGIGVTLVGDILRNLTTGGAYGYGSQSLPSQDIFHAIYVVDIDQVTGEPQMATAPAPWVFHFAYSALFVLFCLGITALILAPIKPWKRQPKKVPVDETRRLVISNQ